MNAKNIILERRFSDTENAGCSAVRSKSYQRSVSAVEDIRSDRESGHSETNNQPNGRPPTGRQEFWNRKIVLDSQRRSLFNQTPERNTARSSASEEKSGLFTGRDSVNDRHTPRHSRSSRGKNARYGRNAYTEKDESVRKHVLSRFDGIFVADQPRSMISHRTPAATDIYIPEHDCDNNQSENENDNKRGYVTNRRVAWSAPTKRRENVCVSAAAYDKRQSLSVTPRSGATRDGATRGVSALSAARSSGTETQMKAAKAVLALWRPNTASAGGRRVKRGEVVSKAASLWRQKAKKRPKTAPPDFEKRQRGMMAPRQQVDFLIYVLD